MKLRKTWIEIQERGLFLSFGTNPFNEFVEILQCFGIAVLNNRAITLDAGAGICMVCFVEHLEKDMTFKID